MALMRIEQETIINFNALDGKAEVYTSDPVWIRKMDKLVSKKPDVVKIIKRTEDAFWYEVPKNMIKVTFPREVSEEQREAAAERFRAMRKNK